MALVGLESPRLVFSREVTPYPNFGRAGFMWYDSAERIPLQMPGTLGHRL